MKDQEVFYPLFVWLTHDEWKGFPVPNPWTGKSWKEECLLRTVVLEAKVTGTPQRGVCRGTASGRGDWDTKSWSLGAGIDFNMSEEAIVFMFENWHLTLQMITQLFGTLIRQTLAVVEVLLVYYWREKGKTSPNFWEQIIDCITHTDMLADAGSKTLTPKINTSKTLNLYKYIFI